MNTNNAHKKPWYRYGMVWMVLSGPALAIVAGIYTIHLAFSTVDPMPDADAYKFGQPTEPDRSHLPAQKARNHAATPDAALSR